MYNTPLLTLGASISLAADIASSAIESQGADFVGFEIAWTGLNANTGSIVVEGAISGLYWCPTSDSYTLTTTSDHHFFMVNPYAWRKLRIYYTANTNTAGSMTIIYCMKIPRQSDSPGPG